MKERAMNKHGKLTWCTMPKHLRGTRRCNHLPEGIPLTPNGAIVMSETASQERREKLLDLACGGEDLDGYSGCLIRVFKKSEHPEFMAGKEIPFDPDGRLEDEDDYSVEEYETKHCGQWGTMEVDEEYGYQFLQTLPGIQVDDDDDCKYSLHYFYDPHSTVEASMKEIAEENGSDVKDYSVKNLEAAKDKVVKGFTKLLNQAAGKELEWVPNSGNLNIDSREKGFGFSAFAYDEEKGIAYKNCTTLYSS